MTLGDSSSRRRVLSCRKDFGVGRIERLLKILAVGADVHARPSADGLGTQQEPGDGAGRRGTTVVLGLHLRETAARPLQVAHYALGLIELLIHGGGVGLVMGLLPRPNLADGEGAVHQPIGPRAVEIEEADGFVGEEPLIRHKVVEGHADQQAQVRQERLHVGRHLGFRLGASTCAGSIIRSRRASGDWIQAVLIYAPPVSVGCSPGCASGRWSGSAGGVSAATGRA